MAPPSFKSLALWSGLLLFAGIAAAEIRHGFRRKVEPLEELPTREDRHGPYRF